MNHKKGYHVSKIPISKLLDSFTITRQLQPAIAYRPLVWPNYVPIALAELNGTCR